MIRSDALDALATALSAAQGKFEAIDKTATNPFFKSKYAPLATVIKAATPILAEHGLSVWQGGDTDEHGELLWTVVMHSSGQYLGSAVRLLLVKNDPQAQGSATTYQRRYQYMAALGLVADDDDDGNSASRRQQAPARATNGAPPPVAAPVAQTERPASAKQRGLIFAKASEANMPASVLANIVLASMGADLRDFDSEEAAQAYLTRALDRVPAAKVDLILKNILAETMP